MAETFLTHRGWILAGFISEYTMTVRPITTLKLIQQAYAKSSPAERKQIADFAQANSDAGFHNNWFLAYAENHDTGRQFLTAGYSLDQPGIRLNLFRQAIDLSQHKEPTRGKHKDSRPNPDRTPQASRAGADTGDHQRPSTRRGKQVVQGLDEVSNVNSEIAPTRLIAGGRPPAKGAKK